jgi:hypothetical protein
MSALRTERAALQHGSRRHGIGSPSSGHDHQQFQLNRLTAGRGLTVQNALQKYQKS